MVLDQVTVINSDRNDGNDVKNLLSKKHSLQIENVAQPKEEIKDPFVKSEEDMKIAKNS